MDDSWLSTTHEIDARSLGGSCKHVLMEVERLRTLSSAFGEAVDRQRANRETGTLGHSVHTRPGPVSRSSAYFPESRRWTLWMVGNRRVGVFAVPLDRFWLSS